MIHPEIALPVLAIVAMVALVTRNGFRRVSRAARSRPAIDDQSLARLDDRIARLEQAVDVIAMEMERIGEGQRFLTRVLTERKTPETS